MRRLRRAGLRPRGMRPRLTALTALVVAAPLLLGVLVLATLMQRTLSSNLSTAAHQQAQNVAAIVESSGPSGINAQRQDVQEGFTVDVLDAAGRLAYSSVAHARTPLAPTRPTPGHTTVTGVRQFWLPGDVHTPLVVAVGVTHDDQAYVVQVASSQQDQHEAVSAAVKYLLLAVPVLVGLSAIATWWLVTTTLRPVERIRAQVERITAARLDDRVPVSAVGDEISTLAQTMNAMLARLQRAQSAQQRFVSDASHELRSPLATVRAALEVGSEDGADASWLQLRPLVDTEVARLQQLVDGLLLLSRADDHGMRLRVVDTDLDDLVADETLRLRARGEHRTVSHVTPVRVRGDRGLLEHVVRNLGDNALRHARSVVQLSLLPDAAGAVIRVEDDGSGVPVAERDHIFDRFVRLDESRSRDAGGSGLGLAISREIVRAHGGRLGVTTSSLGGACFEIWLPLQPSLSESR
ncbi:sensor histidine kinase [Leekyejoonella antrihumi]|uniref:histidine kinase n=1 Tax=Leekyejoonella antrihumi TaxID=1660198 RepID=A0A563E2B9_9MICO|nr:HAMP domain-containing sensor histidine kinase [Leekyejoonella antrihumi]TWP36383.1 HAMP domain-containing histidine kinase [Leekyejoonella antrihumi]